MRLSFPSLLFAPLLVGALFAAPPVAAQSAASIVGEMRAQYEEQLETVDTYVVETNLYTTYHRKGTRDGHPTYETITKMAGGPSRSSTMDTPTEALDPTFLDRLGQHAVYKGTEEVNGVQSHMLHVDNPAAVNEDMKKEEAREMTVYVDSESYVLTRVRTTVARPDAEDAERDMEFVADFSDYRTTDGLTLPFQTNVRTRFNMSDEQRRQMEKMQQKLEQMPEQQREQMKRLMGDSFDQMQTMMAGEPTTIEVLSVRVNEPLPDGLFGDTP